MLEFTKLWSTIVLSIGLLSTTGCTGKSSTEERIEKEIVILAFADSDTKDLHVYMQKGFEKTIKMFTLHEDTTQWIQEPLNKEFIDTTTINYEKNKVIVKENNNILFTDTLPTGHEIKEALGISSDNYSVNYTPYRVEKNFSWDRKTHIVSVGVDKYTKACSSVVDCFNTRYYASINKIEDTWDIHLIYKKETIRKDYGAGDAFYVQSSIFSPISSYGVERDIYRPNGFVQDVTRLSTDTRKSFCFTEYDTIEEKTDWYCLVRVDDKIVKKKIKRYFETQPATGITLSFHHDGKYHVFYGAEGLETGKYLRYEMYTKENLTTPITQQKIYWE